MYDLFDAVLILLSLLAVAANVVFLFFPKRAHDTRGHAYRVAINAESRWFAFVVNAISAVWLYSRQGFTVVTVPFWAFSVIWGISIVLLIQDSEGA